MLSLIVSLCLCKHAACETINETLRRTFNAVCQVESGGDPRAVGDGGRARGIAQIHPIVVYDCNRIMGKSLFSLSDRLDPAESFAMFRIYVRYYAPSGGPEQWSRIWNGGPTGNRKPATAAYWRRVQSHLGPWGH